MVAIGILAATWMDGSLAWFMQRYRYKLPYELRFEICRQIGNIMLDVHEKGYTHRDLDIVNFVYEWIHSSSDDDNKLGYDIKIFVIDFAWSDPEGGKFRFRDDYEKFEETCQEILLADAYFKMGIHERNPFILEFYGQKIYDILTRNKKITRQDIEDAFSPENVTHSTPEAIYTEMKTDIIEEIRELDELRHEEE
jgi:serine/threonine protein kinase